MRRFTAEYLGDVRRGMWDGDRAALDALALADQRRVLDVGAGTGEFTSVLRAETGPDATVLAVDADPDLLEWTAQPRAVGDALAMPLPDGAVDLVACQALLVNLPSPERALREFRRVAADRVAAVEPDNAAVSIDSTVTVEPALAERVREAYLAGIETDVTLGDASEQFAAAGLSGVAVEPHYFTRITEPPYSAVELDAARRKARATRLEATRETLLAGGLSEREYDAIADDWRAMGRTAIDQMDDGRYRRAEVVPYYVTVGRVD